MDEPCVVRIAVGTVGSNEPPQVVEVALDPGPPPDPARLKRVTAPADGWYSVGPKGELIRVR